MSEDVFTDMLEDDFEESPAAMSERPTPRTDALFAPLWVRDSAPSDEELHTINKSHRALERQLAERDALLEEARTVAAKYRDASLQTYGEKLPWEKTEPWHTI